MRVGVLTHSTGDDNYGQILQCYALQRYLKQSGHHPFLIQHKVDVTLAQDKFAPLKTVFRCLLCLLSPHRRKLYTQLEAFIKQRRINAVRNKERRFHEFKSENIELSKFYDSYKELQNDPPKADAYIVGSDQVWNPSVNSEAALAWYLQFGSQETRRISYAASLGRTLEEDEYERFRQFLEGFTAVSVREIGALECCKKAGISNAKLVLDPTLLTPLDTYSPFIKEKKVETPYLFLYYLNVIDKDDLAWNQIEAFMKEKRLKLKPVSSSGYYPAFDLIPGHSNMLLTIPEWLNAVYHCEYMVTTSFHGVAFAIMMHRPFVAILLKGKYSSGNERVTTLLDNLGLTHRILSDEKSIGSILKESINWEEVESRLENLRIASKKFLQEALETNIH